MSSRLTTLVVLSTLALAAPVSAERAALQASKCQGVAPTIVGTSGSDALGGTKARDVIVGKAGADHIVHVDHRDLICGGAGQDRVVSHPRARKDKVVRRSDADLPPAPVEDGLGVVWLGGGADELVISCASDAHYSSNGFNQVYGEAGDDLIDSDCPFGDTLIGGAGDDVIRAGGGRDFAHGGDGDDRIVDVYSTAADCEPNPPPETNLANFGLPDRRCVRSGGLAGSWSDFEDRFLGGEGKDRIVGGEANDVIYGDGGQDELSGGPGNDAINGGAGVDNCDGGSGAADTNSGDAPPYDLADCEQALGFEPFPEPSQAPRRQNCTSELGAERFAFCLTHRPRLVFLNWSPDQLDLSSQPGSILIEPWIIAQSGPFTAPCVECARFPELASIQLELRSQAGAQRDIAYACQRPDDQTSGFPCPGSIEFPQGAVSDTWRLSAITLHDDIGFWSRYSAADLADPNLNISGGETYETFVQPAP